MYILRTGRITFPCFSFLLLAAAFMVRQEFVGGGADYSSSFIIQRNCLSSRRETKQYGGSSCSVGLEHFFSIYPNSCERDRFTAEFVKF